MRFILVYKYGILQTKTERIDVNFCENTTQLLAYLEKRVQQSRRNFIVKFKKGRVHLRVIDDWDLDHYGLKEGTELHIEFIESFEAENNKSTKYTNRYINNLLGINKVSVDEIEEAKEIEEEEDENFSVRKYLDTECERMLKEIQRKNFVGFINIFEEIP